MRSSEDWRKEEEPRFGLAIDLEQILAGCLALCACWPQGCVLVVVVVAANVLVVCVGWNIFSTRGPPFALEGNKVALGARNKIETSNWSSFCCVCACVNYWLASGANERVGRVPKKEFTHTHFLARGLLCEREFSSSGNVIPASGLV